MCMHCTVERRTFLWVCQAKARCPEEAVFGLKSVPPAGAHLQVWQRAFQVEAAAVPWQQKAVLFEESEGNVARTQWVLGEVLWNEDREEEDTDDVILKVVNDLLLLWLLGSSDQNRTWYQTMSGFFLMLDILFQPNILLVCNGLIDWLV